MPRIEPIMRWKHIHEGKSNQPDDGIWIKHKNKSTILIIKISDLKTKHRAYSGIRYYGQLSEMNIRGKDYWNMVDIIGFNSPGNIPLEEYIYLRMYEEDMSYFVKNIAGNKVKNVFKSLEK